MPRPRTPAGDLTLVIDIGKSNAKLLLLDAGGAVVEQHSRPNASVPAALGYAALDVYGLAHWMQQTLRASPCTQRCGHVIASTHGAALVALGDDGLAWEPPDYENPELGLDGLPGQTFRGACDPFADTLSPDLPAGLNAARQLYWMQMCHAQAWRRTRTLLPYPQYWAWLLSGVACSEVSSLGCHTHLWQPQRGAFSALAVQQGWDALFAPLRQAWEVLGPVTPEVADRWGLPADCLVHVGVHDSNACLARYLQRGHSAAGASLTVVSSGTWTVLMAPGATPGALVAAQDMLGNVDVLGRVTPTARFMGGREFSVLLDGASAAAATRAALLDVLEQRIFALPAFSPNGGPFAGRTGWVQRQGLRLAGPLREHLEAPQRAALAALYCAQITAWLVNYLWQEFAQGPGLLVVEGPLAHNALYLSLLQALLPQCSCSASTDTVEGTARGAWLLAGWAELAPALQRDPLLAPRAALPASLAADLAGYQQSWLELVQR